MVHQTRRVGGDTERIGGGGRQGGGFDLVAVGGEHLEAVPEPFEGRRWLGAGGQGQGGGLEDLVRPRCRRAPVSGHRVQSPLQRDAAGTLVAQPHL